MDIIVGAEYLIGILLAVAEKDGVRELPLSAFLDYGRSMAQQSLPEAVFQCSGPDLKTAVQFSEFFSVRPVGDKTFIGIADGVSGADLWDQFSGCHPIDIAIALQEEAVQQSERWKKAEQL